MGILGDVGQVARVSRTGLLLYLVFAESHCLRRLSLFDTTLPFISDTPLNAPKGVTVPTSTLSRWYASYTAHSETTAQNTTRVRSAPQMPICFCLRARFLPA